MLKINAKKQKPFIQTHGPVFIRNIVPTELHPAIRIGKTVIILRNSFFNTVHSFNTLAIVITALCFEMSDLEDTYLRATSGLLESYLRATKEY